MSLDLVSGAAAEKPASTFNLPLAARLALREFRGGISGFGVFLACIALGVAVITAVSSLGDALRASVERQGATLLGGDVTLSRPHKRAEATERAWMAGQGAVSESANVRAMARRLDGSETVLIEIKGIDRAYPLIGGAKLSGGQTLEQAVHTGRGVAVDPIILERLGLKLGDKVQLGQTEHVVTATIEAEPDKIADRFVMGPRLLINADVLEKTTLIDPGSLVSWRYAMTLGDRQTASNLGLPRFVERVRAELPEGGFTIRDRRDPSPGVSRTIERLRQFLTLLGLTALLVGGVGVANAVNTYIERRRPAIATLKAVGATTGVIFAIHLIQILVIAAVGITIGIALGLAIPLIVGQLIGDALPIKADFTVRPMSVLVAALYGFLVTLVFTLWPLGRAEQVRAATLFRDDVAPERVMPRRAVLAAIAASAIALFALGVLQAEARNLAVYFSLAVVGVLAVFFGLGVSVTWLARRIKRPRRPELAIAIGNIGAPGGLARAVVLSLGTGLSLLVAVALVDRSLVGEMQGRLPATSPNYFVLDIKKAEVADFEALVRKREPQAEIHTAPMMRGRIIRVGERAAETLKLKPEHQWVLNGDRGLSYADAVPEGSKVVAGAWWPKGYSGEPQVSFEAELAKALDLKIGDTVTVNVLGRNVTAKVANLREVKWESLAINFVLVFSPNTLAGAPHNVIATVTLPKAAALASEAAIARDIGRAYPATTAIRVKDAINQASAVVARIMTAVRAAGSITLLAGALVLAGALATAQRRRIKQAVILKTLGATRRRILTAHFTEYALLAGVTAIIATVIGGLAAYVTVKRVMDLEFTLIPFAIAQALGIALLLVFAFGGYGTWRILQARSVPHLRSE